MFCSFEPFTTRPVFVSICLCPSSFCVWFFRRHRVLFFSLRRWGNSNLLVWVSPCVFTATVSHYDPYFEDTTYTKVSARTCFFSPTSFVFLVVVGRGLLCLLWASLSLSLLVVWLHGLLACRDQTERGGGLSDGASIYHRNDCFLGLSTKRCPGRSVLNRLCSPHLLPQSPKAGAGRGGGGAGRTVTLMLFWPGGPYCHANVSWLCPVSKGEMLSVFFILCFFVSGSVSLIVCYRSSLLRVAV